MKRSLLFALVLASLATFAADSDFALTLQGVLTSADSRAFSDLNRTLIVRLYPNENSTDILWARSFAISLSTNGLFSVLLTDAGGAKPSDGQTGSCETLLDAVQAAENHEPWAGLQDDQSAGELNPRLRLSRQPRALWTYRAIAPADGFTVGGKLTASSLSATKLTTTGDVRSPSITVVNGVETPDTLNVGSATVQKNLTVTGSAQMSGGVTVTNDLTVTTGGVTAPEATVVALTADTAEFASNATVTVGGVAIDFPVGSITMWSGSYDNIPSGWHICDGEENTPDLRDRFLVGVGDSYKLGDTGGAASVKLEKNQIPKHSHSFGYYIMGYTGQRKSKTHAVDNNTKCWNLKNTQTDETGGDEPHENRPPYYALYFIQRIK